MRFSIIPVLALLATAQAVDVTSKIESFVESKASSIITSKAGTYTGVGASQISSVISNPTQAQSVASKVTSAAAAATSSGAANVNAVGQMGLGAAVVVGGWVMA